MANVVHLLRALQRRLPMEEVAEVRALQDPDSRAAPMRGRGVHGKYCWWTVKRCS